MIVLSVMWRGSVLLAARSLSRRAVPLLAALFIGLKGVSASNGGDKPVLAASASPRFSLCCARALVLH